MELKQQIEASNKQSPSETQHTAGKVNSFVDEYPSKLESSDLSVQQFVFLYSKESDKIGAMVSKVGINVRPEAPTAAACARRRALRISQMTADANTTLVQPTANHVLSCYQQGAKVENPRFATTSNEYGK